MEKPALQWDHSVRYVSVENLRAMCAKVSGFAHQYKVLAVTEQNVSVSYSNPDEYGTHHPCVAYFPRVDLFGHKDPGVVLVVKRVIPDKVKGWEGVEEQAFQPLVLCPRLFRDSNGKWGTKNEFQKVRKA